MSKPPLFIDNIAFAKKNERLVGELSLVDCSRLFDLLKSSIGMSKLEFSPTGEIRYLLQGKTDSVGQNILHLALNANFTAICQRCLSEMPLSINLNFNYLIGNISDTDFEAVDVDNSDDYDLQQASQAMDVIALIEDEIIIAMPIATMHKEACKEIVTQSGEKPNPFAVLKTLIKS